MYHKQSVLLINSSATLLFKIRLASAQNSLAFFGSLLLKLGRKRDRAMTPSSLYTSLLIAWENRKLWSWWTKRLHLHENLRHLPQILLVFLDSSLLDVLAHLKEKHRNVYCIGDPLLFLQMHPLFLTSLLSVFLNSLICFKFNSFSYFMWTSPFFPPSIIYLNLPCSSNLSPCPAATCNTNFLIPAINHCSLPLCSHHAGLKLLLPISWITNLLHAFVQCFVSVCVCACVYVHVFAWTLRHRSVTWSLDSLSASTVLCFLLRDVNGRQVNAPGALQRRVPQYTHTRTHTCTFPNMT